MIVELLGTGGVGKTTVEPLLAARLGIIHYPVGKRRGLDGSTQTRAQVWITRLSAILARPMLFAAAFARIPSDSSRRLWFAMDICRRERNARKAARMGSGVLASGSLHGIAQGSARFGADLSRLGNRITPADVYVRLKLDGEAAAQRLAGRRQVGIERVGDHHEWTRRYEQAIDSTLPRLSRPAVIEIEATGTPEEIADRLAREIDSLIVG